MSDQVKDRLRLRLMNDLLANSKLNLRIKIIFLVLYINCENNI
jgi:hypothetical protein